MVLMNRETLYKLDFTLPKEQVEKIAEAIDPFSSSLSCFEKVQDPSQWTVEALVEEENLSVVEEKLRSIDINKSLMPPKDWVKETYKAFPPLTIGSFYIHGSHIKEIPDNVIPLHIDAAIAFGSGEHPTTKGCLLLLQRVYEKKLLVQPRVFLDMGCGSGILAFAAAKLFHVPVIAADNDVDSIAVCKENADLNGVSSFIQAYVSQGFEAQEVQKQAPYDLIFANILAGPLRVLAEPMRSSLRIEGYTILSGLLLEQKEEVLKAYKLQGFIEVDCIEEKGWVSLLLQRK